MGDIVNEMFSKNILVIFVFFFIVWVFDNNIFEVILDRWDYWELLMIWLVVILVIGVFEGLWELLVCRSGVCGYCGCVIVCDDFEGECLFY